MLTPSMASAEGTVALQVWLRKLDKLYGMSESRFTDRRVGRLAGERQRPEVTTTNYHLSLYLIPEEKRV